MNHREGDAWLSTRIFISTSGRGGGQRWSFTSRIILWQHQGQCLKNQEAKDASSVLFPLITSDDRMAATVDPSHRHGRLPDHLGTPQTEGKRR